MKIAIALKQIHELQYLIGTKIPRTNYKINEIIPAPNDKRFDGFLADYLFTNDLVTTIQLHRVGNFEILLLSIDPKVTYSYVWYKDYYSSTEE